MRIHLIRHGQTEMNAIHTIDTDVPGALLTEKGHGQAASLVSRLDGVPVDVLYVSNLTRTHQTAAPFAQARGLDPIERAGLKEVEAGIWEGGHDDVAYQGYYSAMLAWFDGKMDVRMGEGVTGAETMDRFDTVIREIELSGAQDVAIVSHGAMIGCWAGIRAEGLTQHHLIDRHLDNTGMCVVEGSLDSGYRAISWAGEAIFAG